MFLKTYTRKFATLVLGEHTGKTVSKNTLKLLSAAQKLNDELHLLIIGKQLNPVLNSAKSAFGPSTISKIITADIQHELSENVADIVSALLQKNKYKNIIGISSSYGRDVIPRMAGKYDCQPISDIIQVIDSKTFIRPTYAGNALNKIVTNQTLNFLTFRPSSFDQISPGTNNVEVEKYDTKSLPPIKTEFISEQKSDSSKPDLTTARIVVSGGRAVKSKQNFSIIQRLADAFGGDAAVGASRAAVDAGFCPNQLQVGQTGKVVAPQVYFAIGISGAVQHLAGMKDSKVIVAINTRTDQPIFEVANYGLEGDLFKVLPQLTEKIKKIRSQ